MICTLSETGYLQCCYLGTDPVSTTIPTVMPSNMINVQDAEEQLGKLNKKIKEAMNDPGRSFLMSSTNKQLCLFVLIMISVTC
jgi:hypothetical protein